MNVVIIGAGIGGLTLGLRLHQVASRAGSTKPRRKLSRRVGINLLPHAATANVVLTNRENPPDAICAKYFSEPKTSPSRASDEVISRDELVALSERYQRVAGFDKTACAKGEFRGNLTSTQYPLTLARI